MRIGLRNHFLIYYKYGIDFLIGSWKYIQIKYIYLWRRYWLCSFLPVNNWRTLWTKNGLKPNKPYGVRRLWFWTTRYKLVYMAKYTNICIYDIKYLFWRRHILRLKRKAHFLHYFLRPFYFWKKIAGVSRGEASFRSKWSRSRHSVSYENNWQGDRSNLESKIDRTGRVNTDCHTPKPRNSCVYSSIVLCDCSICDSHYPFGTCLYKCEKEKWRIRG